MNTLDPFAYLVGALSTLVTLSATAATSTLVYPDNGSLVYATYANEGLNSVAGNTIPDFSNAGYAGGGVPIPFIPAVVTLSDDGTADDTTRIQNAIDTVSALSVGPDGFRGAVLLEAGEYTVAETLHINTSGVVIRGAGSQENGGTRITYTATTKSNLFEIDGGSGISEVGGSRVSISDSSVPVGATSFNVSNASSYSVGDRIIIQNTVNQAWLDDMSNMSQWGWSTSGYQLLFRRVIKAINGNEITIDVPIVQTIQDEYGGADIYRYTFSGELENIGFEALRLESYFLAPGDEKHGWVAISMKKLQNGWVRQVTGRYFGYGLVSVTGFCQQITVEDCAMLDHVSFLSGGRRYSFNIDDSQQILFQRCYTKEGRHDYVSGSRTMGPNAFVDSLSENTYADIGPHHRYATGQIYDNIKGGAMNAGKNSRSGGSGHGWTGAQILAWNCDANTLRCDAPNGAMNWSIGSTGSKTADGGGEPYGIWESEGVAVTPRSLYYTQLSDRLGVNALNNIIIPQQGIGTIWNELSEWAGEGLFLDQLVVNADEETIPNTGESLAIQGIVRDLPMLDRGITAAWRKVYGLGTATFADDTALETTVSFDQDGFYLLELTVDDGITTVVGSVIVQVGTGGADTTAPAAPTGLAATANVASISLNWDDNGEGDLAGYDVFRSVTSGEQGSGIAFGVATSDFEDTTAEPGVLYYYSVRAVDTNSNLSAFSAETSDRVNALPTVAFSYPTDGYSFNDGDTIPVTVEASDLGGTITGVELFIGSQSVGTDTTAPYEWGVGDALLENLSIGTYVLEAVATDDNSTTSNTSITIHVATNTAPAAPGALVASANYEWVGLDWADNIEHDLDFYNVYRSTTSGSYGAAIGTANDSLFYDTGLTGGITYYYTVTAVDMDGLESVVSAEVFTVPQAVPPGLTVFGANNDGLAGFTQGTIGVTEFWTTEIGSVRYENQDQGTRNASLLKSYTLDRSDGSSYTIEGVIGLADGYPEDNNRVGIYLFGDADEIPGETEAGALCVLFNFEGGNLAIVDNGLNGSFLDNNASGLAKDISMFGNDITISVDISFSGTDIQIDASFTDWDGNVTTSSATVTASSYTGDFFGYATRSRTRDFGVPGSLKNKPFTMDYKTFYVGSPDNTPPAAPTNLVATAGDGSISLNWDDNGESDFFTYTVYRDEFSGELDDVFVSGLTNSDFIDNSAVNGTTYYYVVTATDIRGNESVLSAEASATPVSGDPEPSFDSDPVVEINATANDAYSASIGDDASDPQGDPMTFSKVSGPSWLTVGTNGALSGTPDITDVGLNTFVVQVIADGGSDQADLEITVDADTTAPSAPANLVATAGDASISLDWDDNADGDFASYSIYRSTTSGSYGSALDAGLISSDYEDSTVVNGTTYYYVITATDTSGNESLVSNEVSATPEVVNTALSVVFGSNNDGLASFIQSTATANETWSLDTDSVQYLNEDGGTQNSSFLRAFTLDRSAGSSYTIEGVVQLTDGYADDNNRVGLYLFGDTAAIVDQNEVGAIGLIFNTDDGSAGGSPGNNSRDQIDFLQGIDNGTLTGGNSVTRTQTNVPYAQDLFGTSVALSVDIAFDNRLFDHDGDTMTPDQITDVIDLTGYLTQADGDVTTTGLLTVVAADFTGDYFGFVTRARARNYAGPGGTPEGRSLPWVMDYQSFAVTDTSFPDAPAGLLTFAGDNQITLDWDDNQESDIASYSIYRSTTSGDFGTSLDTGLLTSDYVDSTAVNGTTYFYVVTATNNFAEESVFSSEVSETPVSGNLAPAFASDPVVEINATANELYSATIADNASDPETDPMAFSKVSGPEWLTVNSDGSLTGTPGVGDVGLNTFTVQVDAAGGFDQADLEITVDADTAAPSAPANLVATAGDASVTLDWDDNAEGDLATYNIYRSTESGVYGAPLDTALATSNYVDSTAANGTTYYYVVTALDSSSNESIVSTEASATPQAPSTLLSVTFGSNNDGLGSFTQSTPGTEVSWSTAADSVQYQNQNAGTQNSSFLREYILNRTLGSSYTIEGVVHLTDGYADDNNRVGLYLFGDAPEIVDENETGAIGLIFNTDDSSSGGAPGVNNPDGITLCEGINTSLSATATRTQANVPYAQDLFGTSVTLSVDIAFDNRLFDHDGDAGTSTPEQLTDVIDITGRLIQADGDITTTELLTVVAADFTGDYLGFVTRARARNYPTDLDGTRTAEERSLPWVMDYQSFTITGTIPPEPLEGFDLWATEWGTDIGAFSNDFDTDGLSNWIEFALGGNPLSDDSLSILPQSSVVEDSGKWIYFTYDRRENAAASGLTFTVLGGTSLVDGLNTPVSEWSVSPAVDGTETVIHRLSIDAEDAQYMKLNIDFSE